MYHYDVFVSYKRESGKKKKLVTPWLREVLDRLEFWLVQELGGQGVEIFFDEDSIEIGNDWPDDIRDALMSAKVLLPVWSPQYFNSSWCVAEWKSFLSRERLLAERGAKPSRLIAPIKFHDGHWFPPEAARVKQLDLSRYTATTRAFWKTKRADELDQQIMRFAPSLARIVSKAPPYEANWPIEMGEPTLEPKGTGMMRL